MECSCDILAWSSPKFQRLCAYTSMRVCTVVSMHCVSRGACATSLQCSVCQRVYARPAALCGIPVCPDNGALNPVPLCYTCSTDKNQNSLVCSVMHGEPLNSSMVTGISTDCFATVLRVPYDDINAEGLFPCFLAFARLCHVQ